MPRKTHRIAAVVREHEDASMRPRPDAAENPRATFVRSRRYWELQ